MKSLTIQKNEVMPQRMIHIQLYLKQEANTYNLIEIRRKYYKY